MQLKGLSSTNRNQVRRFFSRKASSSIYCRWVVFDELAIKVVGSWSCFQRNACNCPLFAMLVLVTFWQQQHDLAAEVKAALVSRPSSKWRCLQKNSSSKVHLLLLQWYSLMLLLPKVKNAAVDMKIRWSSRTYTYFISCNWQKKVLLPRPCCHLLSNVCQIKEKKRIFLNFCIKSWCFFSGKTTSGEKTPSYTGRFPPVMFWHPVLSCFSRK